LVYAAFCILTYIRVSIHILETRGIALVWVMDEIIGRWLIHTVRDLEITSPLQDERGAANRKLYMKLPTNRRSPEIPLNWRLICNAYSEASYR